MSGGERIHPCACIYGIIQKMHLDVYKGAINSSTGASSVITRASTMFYKRNDTQTSQTRGLQQHLFQLCLSAEKSLTQLKGGGEGSVRGAFPRRRPAACAQGDTNSNRVTNTQRHFYSQRPLLQESLYKIASTFPHA